MSETCAFSLLSSCLPWWLSIFQCPAPTSLNELRLVLMATNEPSVGSCSECTNVDWIDSARSESTEPICATPTESANELETLPSASNSCQFCMQLNLSNLSPFCSEIGYVVTKMMYHSIRLHSTATMELHPFGVDAHVTPTSEFGGIPLHLPINRIIKVGDLLLPRSVFQSPNKILLVTSSVHQECSEFRLHVIIVTAHEKGQLFVLSEPETIGDCPRFENILVRIASGTYYLHHVLFLREEYFRGNWQLCHLQPTMLSLDVTLIALEFLPNSGM